MVATAVGAGGGTGGLIGVITKPNPHSSMAAPVARREVWPHLGWG